jgi:hypothetical protein
MRQIDIFRKVIRHMLNSTVFPKPYTHTPTLTGISQRRAPQMIYDSSFKPEWDKLLQQRQSARRTNNLRENKSRTDYQYKVGDKVLVNRDIIQRKLLPKRDGPYEVVRIYDNGTIKLRKGIVVQRINIRRLQPYRSP